MKRGLMKRDLWKCFTTKFMVLVRYKVVCYLLVVFLCKLVMNNEFLVLKQKFVLCYVW